MGIVRGKKLHEGGKVRGKKLHRTGKDRGKKLHCSLLFVIIDTRGIKRRKNVKTEDN